MLMPWSWRLYIGILADKRYDERSLVEPYLEVFESCVQ